jgi:sporulation protein YlmC with PRC-barrel domain
MKRISSVLAAFALLGAQAYAAESFGKIEPAKDLMGRAVHNLEGKVGDIKDFVVDVESGRILYAVVSADGKLVAMPAQSFTSSSESKVVTKADKQKLADAPEFQSDANATLGDPGFAKRAHQHFGETLAWDGTFNNVHKASDLIGMNVNNTSDQKIGDVNNLGLDLRSGRVTYVILGSGGVLGVGDKLYVMPPNAFTLGSDKKTLVSGIDKAKLEGAPTLNAQDWVQIADARFAARVYQHYGKQPYWSGAQLTSTGREEGTGAANPQSRGVSGEDRISRNNANANAARGRGEFAKVEDARQLIGLNIESANGDNLGKLNDMVVDLESGRVLYGVATLKGGGTRAIAPANLTLAGTDKLRFTGNKEKLQNAPGVTRDADLTSTEYAARVYGHYGQEHSWFNTNDKFDNVHRASDVLKMKVITSQDEKLGQVQNLFVDLQKGRVLYVVLNAAQAVGGNGNLFVLPPNAFTLGKDKNTLVTGVDKAKLEAAPRINRGNLNQWLTPARATEIYRYYGKDAYWTSGS